MSNPALASKEEMHPADSYMSQSKDMWGNYSAEDILKVPPPPPPNHLHLSQLVTETFTSLEYVQNDHDMTMQVERPEQIGTQSSDFHHVQNHVQNFRKPMLIE